MKFTETEIEFKALHQKLLDLKLYDLASSFSHTFYKYGHERFVDGVNANKLINKRSELLL
jgi:hypothetical protein